MKASTLLFLSLSIIFHSSSCSRHVEVNSVGTPDLRPVETNAVNSNVSAQNTPVQTVESKSPSNPLDKVLFDGKNYIKKNGWKVPSRRDMYKDEAYDDRPVQRITESGKRVDTTTSSYFAKDPALYTQEFYFEGRDLDWMKGQLEYLSILEMSVKGKVFFYSVSTQKVVSPPPSNVDNHEEPFSYQIMDTDGDGIFETLLGDYDEIIVPNWVLK
jgi:hypothetical protein